MRYNYHTHTDRCKHAVGREDDYIAVAIREGYDGLGISDHIILPGIIHGRRRGDWGPQDEYFASVRRAQEEYKGQLEIFLGCECEWAARFESYYRELLETKKVDYLIFGIHNSYFKNGSELLLKYRYPSELVERKRRIALQALKSGLFSYMAHPDKYMENSPWNAAAERAAIDICKTAKERDIPLEINCSCMRWEGGERDVCGEHRLRYPYRKFWEIARDVGNTVVIGIDAHEPADLEKQKRTLAEQFAASVGITPVERLDTIQKRV